MWQSKVVTCEVILTASKWIDLPDTAACDPFDECDHNFVKLSTLIMIEGNIYSKLFGINAIRLDFY